MSGYDSGENPPKGGLLNGVWYRKCDPPLPTKELTSTKNNANGGKIFYRCLKNRKAGEEQCDFFLWEHETEKKALGSNSQTSAAAAVANPVTPARRPPIPSPAYTMTTEPSASKNKRKRSVGPDDKYDLDDVDDDDLNAALSQTETPYNAAKAAGFTTPIAKRQSLGVNKDQSSRAETRQLQTPRAERIASGDPFNLKTPRTNSNMFTSPSISAFSTQQTPSASFDGTSGQSSLKNFVAEELATSVFDRLQEYGMRLDKHMERDIRALLNRHTKSAEGYRRGREASRAQIKAKDARIAELTLRIGTLEAELQVEKVTVENLQREAENGISVA